MRCGLGWVVGFTVKMISYDRMVQPAQMDSDLVAAAGDQLEHHQAVPLGVLQAPGQGHRFYANVAKHMVGKAELVISPEWARRPIHILDLARRSVRQGCALKAKYK